MKQKCFYLLVAMLMLAFSSCVSNESKVKKLVEDFATAVTKGDKAAIAQLYPEAAKADSLSLTYQADGISIEPKGDDSFLVTMPSGATLLVAKDASSESFTIKESHGVFVYPSERLIFAKKTGWYDDGLNDADNAARMADEGFIDYLSGQLATDVEKKVYAKPISEIQMINHGATYEIEVRNDNDFDLPGDAYEVTATLWGFDFDALEHVKTDIKKRFSGNTVPSHGTCRYKIPGDVDFEYEYWTVDIKITMSRDLMLSKLLKPTGSEYAEYLAKRSAVGSLMLNLTGSIGTSNDAVFVIDRPNGEGEATFTAGGEHVLRKLKLESYEKATGRLVVKEFFADGKYIGDFVGTWVNGVYKGTFTNKTNGGKVNFSLQ